MDNIKYLPLGLFFAYTSKLLILGANLVDAPILIVLGGLAAFYEFKKDTRIEKLQKDMADLNARLDLKDKELREIKNSYNEEANKLRDYMSGAKLAQAFKR